MAWRETAALGLGVAVLVVGANQALAPKTPEESRRQQQEQRVGNLTDSHERRNQQLRDELGDHIDAEEREKLKPGEHRQPVKPRIRLRIP